MDWELKLRQYFEDELMSTDDLHKYLPRSTVVSVEVDEKLIIDLIVFIPDQIFNSEFVNKYGDCYVVNDQKQLPHVFTRFKDYQWLLNDFSRRLAIALWIFQNAIIINDPYDTFRRIVQIQSEMFNRRLTDIIRNKYIEFRSDRHNLRQAIFHQDKLAVDILRANVVKLALEILILANGRPYPYKKWLAPEASKFDVGHGVLESCFKFTNEENPSKIMSWSDELVSKTSDVLLANTNLPAQLATEWWLYLK